MLRAHVSSRHPLLLVVLAAVVALGPTACGSGDDEGAGTTTTTSDPSVSTPADQATTTAAPGDDPTAASTPEPLDDQTPPASINGIAVQGDTLWLASIGGDELLVVDRASGAILGRHDTGGAGPDDVAVAPDGSVYSTGYESGVLGRVVDGTYEEVATLAPLINGVAVADDGTVFVATMAPDGVLYRLRPDGSDAEVVASGLDMLNAFVVDETSGTVVGPAGGFATGWIARIDPADGSVVHVADGLPSVMASTWHPDGRFVALANVTGDVLAVDLERGTFDVLATVAEGAPFDNLAYAPDGTLYLSSFVAPTVTEVSTDGVVRVIPVGTAPPG